MQIYEQFLSYIGIVQYFSNCALYFIYAENTNFFLVKWSSTSPYLLIFFVDNQSFLTVIRVKRKGKITISILFRYSTLFTQCLYLCSPNCLVKFVSNMVNFAETEDVFYFNTYLCHNQLSFFCANIIFCGIFERISIL